MNEEENMAPARYDAEMMKKANDRAMEQRDIVRYQMQIASGEMEAATDGQE